MIVLKTWAVSIQVIIDILLVAIALHTHIGPLGFVYVR